MTLLAHEIAHAEQFRAVGKVSFLANYGAASLLVFSTSTGVVATALAATQGVNLPHQANVFEIAARARAEEVRNYLASVGYGGKGTTCKM